MSREFHIKSRAGLPDRAVSFLDTRLIKTGSWRYQRPIYQSVPAPCQSGCPAGEDIPRWLALVAEDRLEEAWRVIRRNNPLPGVCGRVCFHPCEIGCNRTVLDGALPIHLIERFVADFARRNNLMDSVEVEQRPERVAVIGGGPSGLSCAYHLTRAGYWVEIFEAEAEAGGVLRSGIPAYRLPREVLDREIELLKAGGVGLRTGVRLGVDLPLEALNDFAAVYLAPGAPSSLRLDLGQEDPSAILSGLEFLAGVNRGEITGLTGSAVIIGGGNTALDAARSALRLGAAPTVIYRRQRQDMPASEEELLQAEREGVRFIFQASPLGITVTGEERQVLEYSPTKPGQPDGSGRARPVVVEGQRKKIEAQTFIAAVGETTDLEFLKGGLATVDGLISVEDQSATISGFYAGGDVVAQPRSVVHAIAAGRRAAKAIGYYLRDESPPIAETKPEPVSRDSINLDYFCRAQPIAEDTLPVEEAVKGFGEVNLGLSSAGAAEVVNRCFSCGHCNYCGNCQIFCPDVAVIFAPKEQPAFDLDYCKGCGICALECPRGIITMREEEAC